MLDPGTVHVWFRGVAGADPHAAALSSEEQDRAARMGGERARAAFVAGRALLRERIGASLGMDPAAVPISSTEQGRPLVRSEPDLGFSVSHSGETVVVALARGRAVGMDLEIVRPVARAVRIAERRLAPADARAVAAAAEAERDVAFLRAWVRAEALVKAWGSGLSGLEAAGAATSPAGAEGRHRAVGLDGSPWEVAPLPAPEGYVAALAAGGHGWRVKVEP